MSDHSKKQGSWTAARREERKQAFYLLFEQIFRQDDMKIIIEDAEQARDTEIGDYTLQVVSGVEQNKEEIDKHISDNLRNWTINRISKVSLTAMRIAVYEMIYEKDVPVSVSINEAVELTKEFAVPKDGSFVNGVLASISKQLMKSGEQ